MHKNQIKILVLFTTWIISTSLLPVARIDAANLELKFEDQTFSALIEGVPLRLIITKIKNEEGIWFKGEEFLLDRAVTLEFKGQQIQDGLKRILSGIDHALVFGPDNKLLGVILIAKSENDSYGRNRYDEHVADQHSELDSRWQAPFKEEEVEEAASQEDQKDKDAIARMRIARQVLREEDRVEEALSQEEEVEDAGSEGRAEEPEHKQGKVEETATQQEEKDEDAVTESRIRRQIVGEEERSDETLGQEEVVEGAEHEDRVEELVRKEE